MSRITILYKNHLATPRQFDVDTWKVHPYRFLEFVINREQTFINLDDVASFTVSAI